VDVEAPVEMGARGDTGHPNVADSLSPRHKLALRGVQFRHVQVERGDAAAVVEDDGVAVLAELAGEDNAAGVRGVDGRALRRGEIQATMIVGGAPVPDALHAEWGREARLGRKAEGALPEPVGALRAHGGAHRGILGFGAGKRV
jgi:hypothetical protein